MRNWAHVWDCVLVQCSTSLAEVPAVVGLGSLVDRRVQWLPEGHLMPIYIAWSDCASLWRNLKSFTGQVDQNFEGHASFTCQAVFFVSEGSKQMCWSMA